MARAIAASPVPVISAVGHEVDVTIADFVADLRAPTPSAAAEMVVAAKDEFGRRIDRLTQRLRAAARGGLQRRRAAVHALTQPPRPGRLARRGSAMRGRHAAELTHQLRRAVRRAHRAAGARVSRRCAQRLEARDLAPAARRDPRPAAAPPMGGCTRPPRADAQRADARFRALAGRLDNLSPLAVLGARLRRLLERRPHRDRPTRHAMSPPASACASRCSEGEIECGVAGGTQAAEGAELMEPTIKDFESAIAELETIVKTLEEGDLALEKSLELFERGVQLSRFCHSKLEEAERRIEILNERGEVKPAPASLGADAGRRGDRSR